MKYKSELSKRLESITDLKIESVHVGLEEKTSEKTEYHPSHKYLQDNWSVTISYKGKSYTSNYWQGIGYRELVRPVKKEGNRYYHPIYGDFKNEKDACKAQWLKLTAPKLADVLHCFLNDSSSADNTFENWADEFGYDSDSRKALATYLACQTTRSNIIRVLGNALFEELSQLEH